MNTVLLVESYPAQSAHHYCETWLRDHNKIDCVFFYGDGVLNANDIIWQKLINQHQLSTYACVKSAEAHKIETQPPTAVAGLTTFLAAALTADSVTQFKQNDVVNSSLANSNRNILITLTQTSEQEIQLGLDMILAASAFDNLAVLFADQGIQLLTPSSPETALQKQIKAWPWYDIQTPWVTSQTLGRNYLKKEDLILPVTVLTESEILNLTQNQSIALGY